MGYLSETKLLIHDQESVSVKQIRKILYYTTQVMMIELFVFKNSAFKLNIVSYSRGRH